MKVKDLIKQLNKCNEESDVRVVEDSDNGDPNFWVVEIDERDDFLKIKLAIASQNKVESDDKPKKRSN